MKKIYLLSSILLLSATQAFAIGGTGGDCKKVAKEALRQMNVNDAMYLTTDKIGQGPSADHFIWFTTPACKETGYVNVVTDSNCYVKNIVTRYGCRIPGVPHSIL